MNGTRLPPKGAILIVLLAATLLFPQCNKNCGFNREARVPVVFYQDSLQQEYRFQPDFKKVYGLDEEGSPKKPLQSQNNRYHLPLSLHRDTVAYLFDSTNQHTDTLVLRYERNFRFRGKECGYTAYFEELTILQSSFSHAETEFRGYSYPRRYSIFGKGKRSNVEEDTIYIVL
jgi:hypothetical protein